jgi:hypothetical protein
MAPDWGQLKCRIGNVRTLSTNKVRRTHEPSYCAAVPRVNLQWGCILSIIGSQKRADVLCTLILSICRWEGFIRIMTQYTAHLSLSGIFWYIYPTRCNVTQFILSGNCSTCFRWYNHPSSGPKQLYVQHLIFVTPLLLPAAIGVTNIRCCRYSSLCS